MKATSLSIHLQKIFGGTQYPQMTDFCHPNEFF